MFVYQRSVLHPCILVCLFCLILCGCQRRTEEYGGAKPLANRVESAVQSSVYALPAEVTSKDLLPKAALPDGALLFAQQCSACHQLNGLGVPGVFPPLDGSRYVISDNTSRIAAIMLYGLRGPITVNGITFNSVMTPFRSILKDEELAAIATFIRSNWSNKAGPVDPSVFSEARRKWGERLQFEIRELGEEPDA